MTDIVWLPEAQDDTKRLFKFLEDKNPAAVARAAQALIKGADFLTDYPQAGRPMNDGTGRRELFIPFGAGAYVLRYIVDQDTVVIIRAWHSRENREQP